MPRCDTLALAYCDARESFTSSDPTIPIQASPIIASHARNGRRTYRYRNGEQVALMTHYFDDRPSEYEIFRLGDDQTPLASDNPELRKTSLPS